MSEQYTRRFSDIYQAGRDYPRKLTIVDVLDREIIVEQVIRREGDHGAYLVIEARLDDESIVFTTGSKVVVPKLVMAADSLPLAVTLVRQGRALDIR